MNSTRAGLRSLDIYRDANRLVKWNGEATHVQTASGATSGSKEAGDLLAQIYDWLVEGLDTADPREAKALLDEFS